MAINDISLTSGMRNNLLSLQSTNTLINRTQDRLATGKRKRKKDQDGETPGWVRLHSDHPPLRMVILCWLRPTPETRMA